MSDTHEKEESASSESPTAAALGPLHGLLADEALRAGAGVDPGRLDADDPLVFGVTIAALLTAAVAATLIPALRASRIDPTRALRYE